MTTTWYKTIIYGKLIAPVEVERFTSESVWIGGRRRGRSSVYENYFPTWAEAREFLLSHADATLASLRAQLSDAQCRHGHITSMRPPASAEKEIAK